MSEAGWRAFLAADGLGDWTVLHGGAVAAFRTGSMAGAARLAEALAADRAVDTDEAVLTLTGSLLTVRLTRDLWHLEERHIGQARAVSALARARGAAAEPARVQEVQLAIAARRAEADVHFWRAVLGYDPASDDNAVDPLGHGSTVWMQELDPGRQLRHAMHVDVSVGRDEGRARLDAALAAGGRVVHQQDEHWVLSDRAGNRVCIAVWPDGGTTGPSGSTGAAAGG